MLSTDFSNIARCAEERMDQLWHDACAAKGNDWEPFCQRRWREHETYVAMQNHAYALWRRDLAATFHIEEVWPEDAFNAF